MFIKENTKLSVLVFIVNYKRFCAVCEQKNTFGGESVGNRLVISWQSVGKT